MNRALFVAASGMAAQQLQLDVIAGNLANADVAGFKGATARFTASRDLGVVPLGTHATFEQGKLEKSGGPFDVAIDGPGLFTLAQGKRVAYTRDGEFYRGADGRLQTDDGWSVSGVRIPPDAQRLGVDPDGRVWCLRPGQATRIECGRIAISGFRAPEGLRSIGNARFVATHQSGPPQRISPGGDGAPKVVFGMLERSNVSIVGAMMEILAAQRAYEANAKGVQAADEMQRIANNLHRT
jgi:flagellar basal-body rod protein FlgG